MADLIKKVRVRKSDGTYTNYIPIGVDAINVIASDGESIEKKLNKKVYYYNNVAEMLDDKYLKSGDMIETLGYYEANDGGSATYIIRDKISNETTDNAFTYYSNGKIIELIIKNNTVNIKQLGARKLELDGVKEDIAPYITKYVNYLLDKSQQIKLYIPNGIWFCSPLNLALERGFHIEGDEKFTLDHKEVSTTITSFEDNQQYIFKFGNSEQNCKSWVFKNICLSSSDYKYNDSNVIVRNGYKKITEATLVLERAMYGISDNLFFDWIDGTALKIGSSWENYFKLLNFRHINGMENGVIVIDDALTSSDNITATSFEKIMAEATLGHIFNVRASANFGNSYIGTINFEAWPLTPTTDYVFTTITDETGEDFTHWAIVNTYGRSEVEINNVELNNFAFRYLTYNNQKYCYDTLVNISQDNANPNMVINNIAISGMKMNAPLFRQNNHYLFSTCSFTVNNVRFNRTNNDVYFDVQGARKINCECDVLNARVNREYDYYEVTKLADVIPFYKINSNMVGHGETARYGTLYYDKDTRNNLHLAVKPYNAESGDGDVHIVSANALVTGDNLLIRAKIPAEQSVVIFLMLSNAERKNITLQGTGEYADYTFNNINEILPIGSTIGIRLSPASVGIDCYLDYYKFY